MDGQRVGGKHEGESTGDGQYVSVQHLVDILLAMLAGMRGSDRVGAKWEGS